MVVAPVWVVDIAVSFVTVKLNLVLKKKQKKNRIKFVSLNEFVQGIYIAQPKWENSVF